MVPNWIIISGRNSATRRVDRQDVSVFDQSRPGIKLVLIADIPDGIKGGGITLITAGVMALAFLGFAGMLGIQ